LVLGFKKYRCSPQKVKANNFIDYDTSRHVFSFSAQINAD
jgi:hypothetical protein